MSAGLVLVVMGLYFALLFGLSWFTGRKSDNQTFFKANASSPWYLVAFGMIGASLSGITFISIPGQVMTKGFGYMQVVLGYAVGYVLISFVLLPLYYRLNLTSIYSYLEQRFGMYAYRTGAFFFLLSRSVGASLRLFIVAEVLQLAVFDKFGVPFVVSVVLAVGLIWVYTFRGGMKTIVLTDTLQTTFMLVAVFLTIYYIADVQGISLGQLSAGVSEMRISNWFTWDVGDTHYFWKDFFTGVFITVVMTGLDQDMMQKNLTCKSIGDAQKNMLSLGFVLVPVNLLFLFMGGALYYYVAQEGLTLPDKPDHLFQLVSLTHLPLVVGIFFILGISAAAYSSADSALTALTTSFCYDFLNFGHRDDEGIKVRQRQWVHVGFSVLLVAIILTIRQVNDGEIIWTLFKLASYTYGPLLGMFLFGLVSKRELHDKWIPLVCVLAPIITYLLDHYRASLLFGLDLGMALGLLNSALTIIGLLFLMKPKSELRG